MSTAGLICTQINRIQKGVLFSTRQFLSLGSRGAVDQTLYNLVKAKVIMRVARGVFLRAGSRMPSAYEVAKVKAESFGKRIFTHGADTAHFLGFPVKNNQTPTFASTGRTTSFRFGDVVIRLIGTCLRKLHGEETLLGKVIRALWHIGKTDCTPDLVTQTYPAWSSVCGQLEIAAPFLPGWMNNLFYWGRTETRIYTWSAK